MDEKYEISNLNNYNNVFDTMNSLDYVFKYIELVHKFLNYCNYHMNIQNVEFKKVVVSKGIDLINNIFSILLLYSKNLELSFFNSQKAYCYYCEFIGQIMNENNSFLKLNINDSLMFIYRKIIYNIDQDFREKYILNNVENKFLINIKYICNDYNNLIYNMLNYSNECFSKEQIMDIKTLELIIGTNTKIFNKYISFEYQTKIICYIDTLLIKLKDNSIHLNSAFNIIELFIKTYVKKEDSLVDFEINVEKNIENLTDIHNIPSKKIVELLFISR